MRMQFEKELISNDVASIRGSTLTNDQRARKLILQNLLSCTQNVVGLYLARGCGTYQLNNPVIYDILL